MVSVENLINSSAENADILDLLDNKNSFEEAVDTISSLLPQSVLPLWNFLFHLFALKHSIKFERKFGVVDVSIEDRVEAIRVNFKYFHIDPKSIPGRMGYPIYYKSHTIEETLADMLYNRKIKQHRGDRRTSVPPRKNFEILARYHTMSIKEIAETLKKTQVEPNQEIIERLYRSGADLTTFAKHYHLMLEIAVKYGDKDLLSNINVEKDPLIKLILKYKVNFLLPDDLDSSYIKLAVSFGNGEIVRRLYNSCEYKESLMLSTKSHSMIELLHELGLAYNKIIVAKYGSMELFKKLGLHKEYDYVNHRINTTTDYDEIIYLLNLGYDFDYIDIVESNPSDVAEFLYNKGKIHTITLFNRIMDDYNEVKVKEYFHRFVAEISNDLESSGYKIIELMRLDILKNIEEITAIKLVNSSISEVYDYITPNNMK